MSDPFYNFREMLTETPSDSIFQLHSHNSYEIYLFLQGEAEYNVEEKVYSLSPGDIIIIKKHEMHRVHLTGSKEYHRFVLMVSPEFFVENHCEELEKIFLENISKTGNKISSDIAKSTGLYDSIMRFKKYSDKFGTPYTVVTKSVLIEMLYLLNEFSNLENTDIINKNIANVIHYLNNNFTDYITLDTLCDKFFVSKYYLCHVFKETTGLTIQQYVREKRLVRATELRKNGMSLTEAALQSGFENYSSFFRAFTKRYKSNPTNFEA